MYGDDLINKNKLVDTSNIYPVMAYGKCGSNHSFTTE